MICVTCRACCEHVKEPLKVGSNCVHHLVLMASCHEVDDVKHGTRLTRSSSGPRCCTCGASGC